MFYYILIFLPYKKVQKRGEIVSRIIRPNLITQMFYGLNFIILWGGGRGASPVFTSIIEIVPVVIFDLH